MSNHCGCAFRSLFHSVAVAAASTIFTGSLSAQLTYVTQARTVFSRAGYSSGGPVTQTLSATDFSTFDATAIATLPPGPAGPAPGYAKTHQFSQLQSGEITNSGSFDFVRPSFAGSGYVSGRSLFDVSFDASGSTPFFLSGILPPAVQFYPQYPVSRTIRLTGSGVNITLEGPGAFHQLGTLSTGRYQLLINVDSKAPDLGGTTSNGSLLDTYQVSLYLPEPGDANGDKFVNSADFNILSANYGTLSSAAWDKADFTGDGKVTTNDFNLLAGHFGPAPSSRGTTVPEPGLSGLVFSALVLASFRITKTFAMTCIRR